MMGAMTASPWTTGGAAQNNAIVSAYPTSHDRACANWDRRLSEIRDLQWLGDDWDCNGAAGPSLLVINSAYQLAERLREKGEWHPSSIYASPQGGVVFEWQSAGDIRTIEVANQILLEIYSKKRGEESKLYRVPFEPTSQKSISAVDHDSLLSTMKVAA